MVMAELLSLALYAASVLLLRSVFDPAFVRDVRLARLPPYRGLLPACVSVQVLHAPVCPERRP